MKRIICFFAVLLLPFGLHAGQADWSTYNRLLQIHVTPKTVKGIKLNYVDYQSLFKDPDFQHVITYVESFPVNSLKTRDERLGFYIKAYNVFAIKVVRDYWPLKSIKDAGNWFSPVWDKVAGQLNGQDITLGEIEHKILRPMGEARIHFAIVCASLSCPDLRTEAYTADKLELQLRDQTVAFLTNPGKGLKLQGNTASVSKIFDWFEEDFSSAGGVRAFIQLNLPDIDLKTIEAQLDYDWSLNGS